MTGMNLFEHGRITRNQQMINSTFTENQLSKGGEGGGGI